MTPFYFLLGQAGELLPINEKQETFSQAQEPASPEKGSAEIHFPLSHREIEVSATLPDYPWVKVAQYRGYATEKCIACHEGIEEAHPMSFGCTVCHGGVGDSMNKEEAHSTLIYDPAAGTGRRNPSNLKVVDQSCGQSLCHSGHDRPDRNHIERVKKSLMATLAGVISGLRYQWAGQVGKTAKYGVYPIVDDDGSIPEHRGALGQLEALPYFSRMELEKDPQRQGDSGKISHHIGDSLLRQTCFQCHLDSPGGAAGYRSQGCAACHMTYTEDGLYQGNDATIDRDQPGHPRVHKITALPPNSTCAKCHMEFSGNADSETSSLSPEKGELFPGTGRILQDVHLAKGFDCIDCHTQDDIMGDGNLYSKQHQAVEVRCETCHGTGNTNPRIKQITDPQDRVIRLSRHYKGFNNAVGDWMVVSSRNQKLTNVKVMDDEIVTLGKRSGRKYSTPLTSNAGKAHSIPGHQEKLECTACHSHWVSRCTGCHATYDPSRGNVLKGKARTTSPWNPIRFSQTSAEPVLMIGPRGKAAPMLAQSPRDLNILDEQGNPVAVMGKSGDSLGVYLDWQFVNSHGYSGSNLAYAVSPHSVSKRVRSCASCHLSPRALGLNGDTLTFSGDITGNKDHLMSLDRPGFLSKTPDFFSGGKVTIRGQPIAGSSQTGARPFNQEELMRILKVGNCIPCHDGYDDPVYQNIQESYTFANTQDHRELRKKILDNQ